MLLGGSVCVKGRGFSIVPRVSFQEELLMNPLKNSLLDDKPDAFFAIGFNKKEKENNTEI